MTDDFIHLLKIIKKFCFTFEYLYNFRIEQITVKLKKIN